mgnify:CR=1 FL=1
MQGFNKVTHTRKGMYLNTFKDMNNLTIIDGSVENFILIDHESNSFSASFFYCPVSKYKEGFFNEDDLIEIVVDFLHQIKETVSGWEYPDFKETKIYPGDDDFDTSLATKVALEVANEQILQYQPQYV